MIKTRKDIAFYLIGKLNNFDIEKYYQFALENQYWDQKKIQEYQNSKFKDIIQHAYDNVPYYNRLLNEYGYKPSDFKETSDLIKLPILRKDEIKKNFNDFLAKNYRQYNPVDRYTGGTTGAAFHLYNDLNSWAINWATKIRTYSWGGYEFGKDKLGVMAGGSLLPSKKGGVKNRIWRWVNNYFTMPITQMTDASLENYANILERKHIRFLRGYPSAIYTLAKYLSERNRKINISAVFSTAEMLHDHQRILIEKTFNCKCFDQYGCADGMGGANECNHHIGMHINIDTSLMNVIDNDGNEVKHNEEGEIVLTSFYDKAMPLIRYAPGDYAIKSEDKCSCGRTLPMIKKIIGRTSDLIKLSNGINLNGLSIPFEVWSDKIERFQIVQTKPNAVEVVLIKKQSYTQKDETQVLEMMNYNCGSGIDIQVKYVDNILLPESGKFRYVISLVK